MPQRRMVVPGITVSAISRAARRRWSFVVAATLLGLALGLLITGITSRSYTALSTLTINPITSTLFATGPLAQQVNTATEAEVMSSGEVRTLAAAKLADGTTAADLKNLISVSIPGNSLALSVQGQGATAEQSAKVADAMADSYLAYRRAQAEQQVKSFLDRVDARIKALEKQLANKSDDTGISAEIASLRRDQSVALTLVINPGTVIQRATAPSGPSWPRLLTLGAAGAALGFLIGLAITMTLYRREGLVFDVADLDPIVPKDIALSERFALQRGAVAAKDWSDVDDQALALRVGIERATRSDGPIVIIGPSEVAPLAAQLQRSFAGLPQREVKNLAGAPRGQTSLAVAGAAVLVVAAIGGVTKFKDMQPVGDVIELAPQSVPVVTVMASDGVN